MRKAPNGESCWSRRWPFRSLARALSSRQLKALEGVGWSRTAVGKGRQEGKEEFGRGMGNEGKDSKESRWRRWREKVQCPRMPPRSRQGAIEANGLMECEKAGNPRAVLKARQAGKGGVGGHFTGT